MHAKHRWLAGDLGGARGIMEEVRPCLLPCLPHPSSAGLPVMV